MPQARDEAGNIWEVDAQGNAVRLIQPANQPPADPTYQYEGPQAAANVQRTQTQTQGDAIDNSVTQATAPTTIQTNEAPAGTMWVDPTDPSKGVTPIPGYKADRLTPQIRADAIQAYEDARSLDQTIAELRRLYASGPGATSGIWGLGDYLPTGTNRTFDSVGQRARGPIKRALGFTGGEGNTMAESEATYGPYTPRASDYDDTILSKIEGLEQLSEAAKRRATTLLGGVPDEAGNIVPATDEPDPMLNPGALDVLRTNGGQQERGAAGYDATTESVPAPPEMVREHEQLIGALVQSNGGRLDPQAYANARAALDRKYGRGSVDASQHEEWAKSVNQYLDAGGRTIPTGIEDDERVLGMVDTLRNKAVNNPLGAAAAGFANAGGFGIPGAILPDQAAALADANPVSNTLGEIGGAITGTGAIGSLGRGVTGRVAPRLLGGGGRAQVGRSLGADVAYGTIYGTVNGEDPLTSAALSGVGSLGGQALGKAVGAGVGGLRRTDAAQRLMDSGVGLTVGRQLGGLTSRAEDLLQSVPFIGGQLRARNTDSFKDWNLGAFERGATSLNGFSPSTIGREGLDEFDDALGSAYGDVLASRSIPLDGQFDPSLAPMRVARDQLPDDLLPRTDKLLGNHLGPIHDTGEITAEVYQRARRGLGAARNNANQIAAEFDQPYRETMTGALDAIDGQLYRGGGGDVVEGLNAANAANKNFNILENASLDAAKVGTQAGEVNVFTPAQLLTAARASERKFGSDGLLREWGELGQEVLPSKIPNSATADRTAAQQLLGGLGGVSLPGLGAGAGYLYGGTEGIDNGVGAGLGLTAALAMLSTRQGQRAAQLALMDRPDLLQRGGRWLGRKSGLFGSAGTSLMVQQ